MEASRKLIVILVIFSFISGRKAKINGTKFLCEVFTSRNKIILLFVVPTTEKSYCKICQNSELPYLQWRKIYKLYKEKPWINIIFLTKKDKIKMSISKEIKRQKIEKLIFREALTIICKNKEPLLVLYGNIDMAGFREIVRILNREEK